MTQLDLSKWGGFQVRQRLEALDPAGKDVYRQFFPFIADVIRETNAQDLRIAALEARPQVRPFP